MAGERLLLKGREVRLSTERMVASERKKKYLVHGKFSMT